MTELVSTLKLAFRELVAFRLDFLFLFLGLPLRIVILWLMWDFLLQDPSNFPQLEPTLIFAYVIFNAFLQWSYAELDNAAIMERNIVMGNAVVEMTLPMEFHRLHFYRLLPAQLLVTAVGLVVLLLVHLFGIFRMEMTLELWGLPVAVGLAVMINYFIASIIAALSIRYGWISKTKWTLIQLFGFLGGLYVPLTIFPDQVQWLTFLNPLASMYDLPASIFIGIADLSTILMRLGVSLTWLMGLYLVHRLLWKRSLEHFTAPGG